MADSTIGGITPAYATVELWLADTETDLVTATEGERGLLRDVLDEPAGADVGGATTSALYYRELTTDTGAEHDGTAGSGARVACSNNQNTFTLTESFFRVTGIEIYGGAGQGNSEEFFRLEGSSITFTTYKCIMHDLDNANSQEAVHMAETGTTYNSYHDTFYNLQRAAVWSGMAAGESCTANIYNAIAYECGTDSGDGAFMMTNSGGTSTYNIYNTMASPVGGGSGEAYHGDGTSNEKFFGAYNVGTDGTCATIASGGNFDNTSSNLTANATFTTSTASAAYIFTNLTDGSEDFHLTDHANNDAVNGGIYYSTPPAFDFEGDARPGSGDWDLGPDEIPASATKTFAGTITGASTVSGAFFRDVPYANTVTGAGVVAGAFARAQRFANTIAGTSSVVAAFKRLAKFANTVTGAGTVTGAFFRGAAYANTIAGAGVVTGAQARVQRYTGDIGGASTVASAFFRAQRFANTITGAGVVTGAFTTSQLRQFAGSITGGSTVTSAFFRGAAFAGTITGVGVVTGAFFRAQRFANTITGSSSVSGAFSTSALRMFAGSITGGSSVSGDFYRAQRFANTITGSSIVTALFFRGAAYANTIAGGSTVTSAFFRAQRFAVTVTGTSSVSGAFDAIGAAAVTFAGTVTGGSSVSGAFFRDVPYTGTVTGAGVVTGAFYRAQRYANTITGAGVVSGAFKRLKFFANTITGGSTVTSAFYRGRRFTGSVTGGSTVTSAFYRTAPFSVTITGASTVVGAFTRIVYGAPDINLYVDGEFALNEYVDGDFVLNAYIDGEFALNAYIEGSWGVTIKNQIVEVWQGDDKNIVVPSVPDGESTPSDVVLDSATYSLNEDGPDGTQVLQKTATITPVTGKVTVALEDTDTAALEGEYYHEIKGVDVAGKINRVMSGRLVVRRTATHS